jgi:cell division protease FtsH
MSEEVGPVDLRESEEHPFLGREIAQPRRYSEHSSRTVDKAVRDLILESEQQAVGIIKQHRALLDQLIAQLEEKETLYLEDIKKCLGPVETGKPLKEVK